MVLKWSLDNSILFTFILINLVIGISTGKGIKDIREYAVGNREFSNPTIAATIIATWIAGSSFVMTVSEVYNKGLYFIIPGLSDGLSFFLIAYFIAPRMGKFLGKLSVAEVMGGLYGKEIRTITAISGIFPAIGNVAIQFTTIGLLLSNISGSSSILIILISSIIIIVYSTLGGIRAVTFTDIIQFFAFGVILPMVALLIWNKSNPKDLLNILSNSPLFDYKEFFNYRNPSFISTFTLFFFFLIPGLDPAIFQRILMCKNVSQIARAFNIAGWFIIVLQTVIISSIGILLLANSDKILNAENLITYISDNYLYIGFKGFFMVGITAMVMSTADSYLNSSAVLLSYDLCKTFGVNLSEKNELQLARASSLLIGICALGLSLYSKNLLNLILHSYSFYMPIVSVPLLLAIFGFRISSKAVFIGMVAGFITVITLKLYPYVDSLIPGMLANFVFLFISHYLLSEESGWVVGENIRFNALTYRCKEKVFLFIDYLRSFSGKQFLEDNKPKEVYILIYFGIFSIITTFSNAYSMPSALYEVNNNLLNIIYLSMSIVSVSFIIYPVWLQQYENNLLISIYWGLSLIYYIFVNALLVLMSNYNSLQFTVLMSCLVTVSLLLRWQVSLLILVIGISLSIKFYQLCIVTSYETLNTIKLEFKIIYSLLLFSTVLIAFIKPKQQSEQKSELIRESLKQENNKKMLDLIKISHYREEFFNRLNSDCINVFKSMFDEIFQLEKELKSSRNKNIKSRQVNLMIDIAEKLKSGAEYLEEVIWEVKTKIKPNVLRVNLKKFFYEISKELRVLYVPGHMNFFIDIKTNLESIEIDPNLIKKVLFVCIDQGLNSISTDIVEIIIEDRMIEYTASHKSHLKLIRDAVKIRLTFESPNHSIFENNQILEKCKQIIATSIDFIEANKILVAHYGEIEATLDDRNNLTYIISIPSNLTHIRPKKMNLPDDQIESLYSAKDLIRAIMVDTARKLIKVGIDYNHIVEITNLTFEEIRQLEA
ncbi:MAG: hypothetical protein K0Q51_164 [Rickettsiaceae bacterium]|jgi:Na+/proline symporter|nr:hypothetical protein [Rickettsiaceae bacterium]